MRILLVSYYFPPYNAIGAVRVGKFAKYLAKAGNDVRVVTAADQPLQATLPLEIDPERVVRTPWININRPAEWVAGGRARVASHGYGPSIRNGAARNAIQAIGNKYKNLTNVPDGQVGWGPFAARAGRKLISGWRPDVIFASGLPWTSLAVGRHLSRRFGVPWVAELRDLWADNCYNEGLSAWRRRVDRCLEARVLRTASGLVTVSNLMAESLNRRYQKPTRVVMSGFDPDDQRLGAAVPYRCGRIEIVYTGMIYKGRRDPTPLFRALARMGPAADAVRVSFYGRYLDVVRQLAVTHGVERLVTVNEPVSYGEALRIQAEADILLLLLWNDPREEGVFPGKVFEYIGARRPILVLGAAGNVAASLIGARRAGVVLLNESEIAAQLEAWIATKHEGGSIEPIPAEASVGLTREEQTQELEEFLRQIAGAS